jgi:hypothetical protein
LFFLRGGKERGGMKSREVQNETKDQGLRGEKAACFAVSSAKEFP